MSIAQTARLREMVPQCSLHPVTTLPAAALPGLAAALPGPEIKALYVENDRVYIECSPSCSVVIRFETRRSCCKLSHADDITFADFDISGDYEHFRLEVKDKYGNKAMTKAYTKKDL